MSRKTIIAVVALLFCLCAIVQESDAVAGVLLPRRGRRCRRHQHKPGHRQPCHKRKITNPIGKNANEYR